MATGDLLNLGYPYSQKGGNPCLFFLTRRFSIEKATENTQGLPLLWLLLSWIEMERRMPLSACARGGPLAEELAHGP
jgi:hypothetical protein